jgi:hypothetical protein
MYCLSLFKYQSLGTLSKLSRINKTKQYFKFVFDKSKRRAFLTNYIFFLDIQTDLSSVTFSPMRATYYAYLAILHLVSL